VYLKKGLNLDFLVLLQAENVQDHRTPLILKLGCFRQIPTFLFDLICYLTFFTRKKCVYIVVKLCLYLVTKPGGEVTEMKHD